MKVKSLGETCVAQKTLGICPTRIMRRVIQMQSGVLGSHVCWSLALCSQRQCCFEGGKKEGLRRERGTFEPAGPVWERQVLRRLRRRPYAGNPRFFVRVVNPLGGLSSCLAGRTLQKDLAPVKGDETFFREKSKSPSNEALVGRAEGAYNAASYMLVDRQPAWRVTWLAVMTT